MTRAGRGLAALVIALLAGLTVGTGSAAALVLPGHQVTFGDAKAVATFGQGIDVSEKATLPDGVSRVEVLLSEGSSSGVDVVELTPTPGAGAGTLTYRLDVAPGAVIPNTVLHFRFRVTLADASLETGPEASVRYQDTRFDWKTLTGTYVTVHWVDGDATFGHRALAIGDKAIADASAVLGVTEKDPIDFFIYPDPTSFRDVLGPATRENVGGVAFPDIRTLIADIGRDQVNDSWVGIVIPHELTHLVFGTATANPYHEPPHWLNEGLAVYLSQGFDSNDRGSVSDAVSGETLMPLPSLSGQFPTAGDRFALAYAESVSAIDFMVRTYGKPALVKLITSYAAGRTDDEAFDAALGVDVAGFEAAWVADLGTGEPSPYGPQPAPPGNVPAEWGQGAVNPGTVSSATPAPGASPGPTADSGGGGVVAAALAGALAAVVLIGALAIARRRRAAP